MFNGIKKFYTKNKKISKIGFIALAICISYIVTSVREILLKQIRALI